MNDALVLTGMVLSAAPQGEHDKRVVLLTKERGRITAFARGARRQNSPMQAGTNPFSFGKFTVYEGRNAYTLVQTEISNYFRELASDVEGACYGFYFLELADYYGEENQEAKDMLLLLYQTLRALMSPKLSRPLIRRIYELKMLVIQGEYPAVQSCTFCGTTENLHGYSALRGGAYCRECASLVKDPLELNTSTFYAMQYVILAGIEKLYTFRVTEEVQREFEMVMNRHMDRYVEHTFRTLDILEMMCR